MKDIIDYYEDGGPSTGTAEQKKAHKDWAEDWMKKLNAEFYDNANPLGRQGMYLVLKRKFRGDNEYPTKRFVGAWLRRQIKDTFGVSVQNYKSLQKPKKTFKIIYSPQSHEDYIRELDKVIEENPYSHHLRQHKAELLANAELKALLKHFGK